MTPCRVFSALSKLIETEIRQLHPRSAKILLDNGYIEDEHVIEKCSLGEIHFIFHKVTDKGYEFYHKYKNK